MQPTIQIILIFLAALSGVLLGIFLTLLVLKSIYGEKRTKVKRGERYPNKGKEKEEENIPDIKAQNDNHDDDDHEENNHDDIADVAKVDQSESKYEEGSVLAQKLKRDEFNMFDYSSSIEGKDPEERLKERQSKEDASYCVLKDKKKK